MKFKTFSRKNLKLTETKEASHQYGSGPRGKIPHGIGAGGLTLMTIGGIMGSGLFLASGSAIRLAGPAIAISFLIGVTIMSIEISALAEMSAADPERGSFLAFARHTLGPGSAFIGGWIFWFSSVLNLAAEATAGAIFTRLWFPGVPVFVFSVGYSIIIVGINFLTVKGFSSVESVMSLAKVIATVAFIAVAGLVIFHVIPVRPMVGPRLWTSAPSFFPRGILGMFGAMVLVLFSMSGTGILGLAASNVKRPEQTISRTIRNTVIGIYVLYVGAALAITGLLRWNTVPTAQSPFTGALRLLQSSWLVDILNFVIVVAVLSTLNAGLFATDRVLATLGRIHDAPHILSRESRGIPRMANAVTGVLLVIVSGLAYFLLKTAYLYLVTATGFQALMIWILIIVTQIYFRPRLEKRKVDLKFQIPWYPMLSWIGVVLIVGVVATAPLAPHEVIALGISLAATGVFAVAYLPVKRARQDKVS